MPYCCTWLIVAACWLLQAPSLGTLSSQHLHTFGCPLPGSQRLLLPKRHFFSPQMWESLCPFNLLLSKCWLAGAVMSTGLPTLVVNTRPLTVHPLWAPFLPSPSLFSSASPSLLHCPSLSPCPWQPFCHLFGQCGIGTLEFPFFKKQLPHRYFMPVAFSECRFPTAWTNPTTIWWLKI